MAESSGGSALESVTWQCLECQERMGNVRKGLIPKCCMFCQSQNIQSLDVIQVEVQHQELKRDPSSSLKNKPTTCSPHAENSVANVTVQVQSELPQLESTNKTVTSVNLISPNSGTQKEPRSADEPKLADETKDSLGTINVLQTPAIGSSGKSEAESVHKEIEQGVRKLADKMTFVSTCQANGENVGQVSQEPERSSNETNSNVIGSNEQRFENENENNGLITAQQNQSGNINAPGNLLPQVGSLRISKPEHEAKKMFIPSTEGGDKSPSITTQTDRIPGHPSTVSGDAQSNSTANAGHISTAKAIKESTDAASVDPPEMSSLQPGSELGQKIVAKAEGNGGDGFEPSTYARVTATSEYENSVKNDLDVQGLVRGEEVW